MQSASNYPLMTFESGKASISFNISYCFIGYMSKFASCLKDRKQTFLNEKCYIILDDSECLLKIVFIKHLIVKALILDKFCKCLLSKMCSKLQVSKTFSKFYLMLYIVAVRDFHHCQYFLILIWMSKIYHAFLNFCKLNLLLSYQTLYLSVHFSINASYIIILICMKLAGRIPFLFH